MTQTYRILVADDHPLARKAVRSVLETDPLFTVVGEAASGAEAIELAGELFPDIVLMDIRMPDMDGLEATKRLKKRFPALIIVILTVSDAASDLFTALQFGAQGYLLKNMDPDEWLRYLHALLDGNRDVPRQFADRLLHQFRAGTEGDELLTEREKQVAACVAAGQTNRQIAEQLGISENTVKNHLKNIMEKLQVQNRVQLTAAAIKQGWTSAAPDRKQQRG
jgi:DNA-binding NarL/FixJ family response regulator